jgi:hypothetical protein
MILLVNAVVRNPRTKEKLVLRVKRAFPAEPRGLFPIASGGITIIY